MIRKIKNDQSSQIGLAGFVWSKMIRDFFCASISSPVIGLIFAFKERNPEATIADALLADPTGTMTLPQNRHRSSSSIGSAPQWRQRISSVSFAEHIAIHLSQKQFSNTHF
jgi:hypothetical protein